MRFAYRSAGRNLTDRAELLSKPMQDNMQILSIAHSCISNMERGCLGNSPAWLLRLRKPRKTKDFAFSRKNLADGIAEIESLRQSVMEEFGNIEPDSTDSTLMRRFREGEDDAATELYKRYAQRLFQLASVKVSPDLKQRVDPEDIVQSVFRTFFRRASQGQYEAPDGEELWKLLLVIGLNKIREVANHHYAGKRDLRVTDGGDFVAEAADGQGDIALLALRLTIEELLAPLPPSYREIVRLRIERFEVAEIAERTGRSKRSVERILHEIQRKLHGSLNEA